MSKASHVELLLSGVRDTSGQPLSSGKVYTYDAGTTTPKNTFTDLGKTTPAANPIILDSNGKAQIYADGNYKFVIKNSSDSTLYTHDNIYVGLDDGRVLNGGTSTGSSGAYSISISNELSALAHGQQFTFIANHTNTTSTATLNVNGLGAKNIRLVDGSVAFVGYEICSGCPVRVMYSSASGGVFILLNPDTASSLQTFTPTYSASGSMTFTSVTTTHAEFKRRGIYTDFSILCSGTTGGVASTDLFATVPFTVVVNRDFHVRHFESGFGGTVGWGYSFSSTQLAARKTGAANWTLAANTGFTATGTIRSI